MAKGDGWPGHSSSSHLESCYITQRLYRSAALFVSQIVELRGDSKPLPFAHWLLGKQYSYLKMETLAETGLAQWIERRSAD